MIVLVLIPVAVAGAVLAGMAARELRTRRAAGERLRDWPRDLRRAAREAGEAAARTARRTLP